MITLGRRAFERLQSMFFEASGIQLSADKVGMVEARLRGRVQSLALGSFDDYCDRLKSEADERQRAIDLLTVNETYFFREPEQFEELSRALATRFRGTPVRVWSAACSTGEEPYSLAMRLLDNRPDGGWELRASDLSTRVVEQAKAGVYPMHRLEQLPPSYLKRFCLRGTGEYEGMLRVDDRVRGKVHFFVHNLLHTNAALGTYEVIFLRNVLIYFEHSHRGRILTQIVDRLRPGGLLFIGTAESLQGHVLPVRRVGRSIFEKVGGAQGPSS
ncbi:MAG: methyltransferase, CheR-type [Myxococcaceae bacterium]|nr:methyltransferase, CheR-type [Myxococcaceae bacterium]